MPDWLSAEEAMTRLGVRPQTLYAYVSRGRVRAEADPVEPRRSRYKASDIAALAQRKARGRKAADVAAETIAWGEPVLASAITTVADGRLFYRGRDAVKLAETETLESVARLLRGGHGAALKRSDRPRPPTEGTMRERLFFALAARAGVDPPTRGRASLALAVEAATLLDVLTDAIAGDRGGFEARVRAPNSSAIHQRLGFAWGLRPAGAEVVRRALVLLADHELNASTFAARVAASTGASLAAAALAGLSALSGPLHGGMAARVMAFAAEAERVGAREAVAARLAQGLPIPGIGHQLYPDGDPRAEALLAALPAPARLEALRVAAEAATGLRANVDFALVSIAECLALPEDAPFALFAVARAAGWIAHALEQLQTGQLIRPRARYVGAEPEL
ncbi:MAG: citrate/2-methylcitrate synthase [Caulobacterales bacterium]